MPMTMCASCGKMISISHLPGGNPIAKAYPGMFAMSYGECDRCHAAYCDRCINSNGGKCPGCGRRIEIKGAPEGETGDIPPEYLKVLGEMESEGLSGKEKRSKGRMKPEEKPKTEVKVLLSFVAALGLTFGLTLVTANGSTINNVAWIGFNGIGVLTVFAVVSPAVGNLLTATLGEMFRHMMSRAAMAKLVRFWILLYVAAILLSPWFIYHAHYAWQLKAWWIAYGYAAILGALLGGIILLGKYQANLRG